MKLKTTLLIVVVVAAMVAVASATNSSNTNVATTDVADDYPTETISGVLEKIGDDYFINGVELCFGPDWYITKATASYDYDGDGNLETIAKELDGLVGKNVTVEGKTCREDFDVFSINGLPYRDIGKPPWAGGPPWARAEEESEPPWAR